MKPSRSVIPSIALALAVLGCVAPVRAQLETYNILNAAPGPSDPSTVVINSGDAYIQTFTNATQFDAATFRFMAGQINGSSNSLDVYLVAWTSTNAGQNGYLNSATPIFQQTLNIPATTTFTGFTTPVNGTPYPGYDAALTVNSPISLSATQTYALVLVDSGGTASGTLDIFNVGNTSTTPGQTGSGDAFNRGNDYAASGLSSLSDIVGSGSNITPSFEGGDLGLSNLELTVAPEPAAAAAILLALFVAGLAGLTVYRRRTGSVLAGGSEA